MILYCEISIYIKVTLVLHAQLSLSRDGYCKAYVNQRLFPFSFFLKERFTSSLARVHISENQHVKIIPEYRFGSDSCVTVTFLLSQCTESHRVTRVPSPTISMIKRTTLYPPMDSYVNNLPE